jgi:hypothetical protein
MTFVVSGAIAGAAITAFTAPTYTFSVDTAPDLRSKQYAMTAIGGTQTGVLTHTVNNPATITFRRPSLLKTLKDAFLNGVTGQFSKVPMNEYTMLSRKGMLVAANNQPQIGDIRVTHRIPAGSETFDAANVKALISMTYGVLANQSSGIADTVTTGIM